MRQPPDCRYYTYRCTTDKLEHHLNRITDSGDAVVSSHYLGGRDWLVVCLTPAPAAAPAAMEAGDFRRLSYGGVR